MMATKTILSLTIVQEKNGNHLTYLKQNQTKTSTILYRDPNSLIRHTQTLVTNCAVYRECYRQESNISLHTYKPPDLESVLFEALQI